MGVWAIHRNVDTYRQVLSFLHPCKRYAMLFAKSLRSWELSNKCVMPRSIHRAPLKLASVLHTFIAGKTSFRGDVIVCEIVKALWFSIK